MNPFPAFAIPSLAIMSGCDRIPSGRRCAATPTISTWCLQTLLTKLLELAERWVGRIFCFRELLSHWGLQFKIYLSIKTREEVAKLATAVANVPVNPGALTFFLYTLQVASVKLYRRAGRWILYTGLPLLSCQYTQRLNMNLTAINSSWTKKVHLKPKVRQDYKEIYLPAFNGHFLFQFVPILFVISTSSMLILDQRTMQIKYRWGASS